MTKERTVNVMDFEKIAHRIISSGQTRTAGTIEFKKDQGPVRRDVRVKDYDWSTDSLRDLAKILWASQRAHSYAMAALRLFSKMPSSEFSPDGLLGGRGYIQSVKDMRSDLSNTVEFLSSFTDTLYDEINAEHWASAGEKSDVNEIVSDAEQVKQNPEKFVEDEFVENNENGFENGSDESEDEEEPVENPVAENPEVIGDDDDDDDDDAPEPSVPRTSSNYDKYNGAFNKILSRFASNRFSGGALDELLVPGLEPTINDRDLGGPRVYPIGPSEGDGEFGNYDDPLSPARSSDGSTEYDESILNSLYIPLIDNPTDGSDYSSRLSSVKRIEERYSWLPGADNRLSMNWYDPNLTEEDIEYMKKNCDPSMPDGILPKKQDNNFRSLWDLIRVK